MRLALLGTFLFLLAVSAQAERGVRVVIGSIGSATSDSFHDPDASTPSVQIARELMNRLGYRQPIELVPFARAVNETQRSDNIVMIPLARTPRRENKYQWLNLLWEDDCVLVRAADKGNTDISKIGVVRASATEEVAEILGLANVELSTDDIQNALKL
ncbi:MAG: hypothetical protein JO300_07085, partial [Silvibacterium sp.]|nr:hypothetical protein [Silvibacterium sp.]